MATIIIPTSQNIELEYPVAPISSRIGATIIDGVFVVGYFFLLTIVFQLNPESTEAIIAFLPAMLYSFICEAFFNGQTLGKRIFNLQVIMRDGSSPTTTAYFLRWILRPIDIWLGSVLLLPGLPALLTVIFNKNGQRLGDITAGTSVIKLKLVANFNDTIFMDTADNYAVQFPEIRKLSDRDMQLVKELLETGKKRKNPELLHKLKQKICDVSGIETKLPPQEFLLTIMKDYNHIFGRKNESSLK